MHIPYLRVRIHNTSNSTPMEHARFVQVAIEI
jgi:hypothetical protein